MLLSRLKPILAIIAVAGLALAIWALFSQRPAVSEGWLGYVEGEAIYVAAPVAGALESLDVRRGDSVAAGARLFALNPQAASADTRRLQVAIAIAEGRKGPAKGGVLDGNEATRLRALLAEQSDGRTASDSGGTVRGLARLLRRNPTDAERMLWKALTTDRRFASHFKRQTPVGRHIPDFVSFTKRIAIELANTADTETVVRDRAARDEWLEARGYRICLIDAADVEADLPAQLDRNRLLLRNYPQ